jgi:hypothetical protein
VDQIVAYNEEDLEAAWAVMAWARSKLATTTRP